MNNSPILLLSQLFGALTLSHIGLSSLSKKYREYFKLDLALFLTLTVGVSFSYIFVPDFFYKFVNGWPYNEWLVNYQGGLVRRGFTGEILFQLNKFGINPKYVIFAIGIISFYHIVLNILFLIKDKHILFRAFVLFNPFGLLYFVQNIDFFFARRDLFYLNFFIYLGKRKKVNFTVFMILATLLILNYGIYIFLVFTFYYVLKEKDGFDLQKFKYASAFFLLPLNVLLLTVFRYVSNFEKLCTSINTLNKNNTLQREKNCWGAPQWLNRDFEPINSAFSEIAQGINYYNNFSNWVLVFLIFFISLFFVVEMDRGKFLQYLLLISPYFGLFFIAQDWGRWLLLIFFTFLINNLLSNNQKVFNEKLNILFLFPVFINMFVNVPSHLFRNIKVLDIRSLNEIILGLTDFIYSLVLPPYIIIFYGYNPPIVLP